MVASLKHITVLCFFLSSIFLEAQVEIRDKKIEAFKIFDTEDGFPAVSLRAGLTQDSLGFIWLASHIGLYRFDGYNVKSFHSDPEDSSSLHDNYVSRFMTTKAGQQLIGSAYQGIAEYLPETNTFLQWTPIIKEKKFGNIRKLLEDRQGFVWAVSSRGLHKFNPKDKSFKRIDITPDNLISSQQYMKHTSFYDLAIDPEQDQLWLAGRFGLFKFDIKTEQYEWFFNEKFYDSEKSPQTRMTGIAFDKKRKCVWVISRGNGIFQFFPKTKKWVNKISKNRNDKLAFYFADGIQNFEDEILISDVQRKGPLFYNKDKHTFENIIFQKGEEPRKFTFGCYASFLDRNGYLISDFESGLIRSNVPVRPVEKLTIPHIALTNLEWKKEKLDSLNPVYLKKLSIERAPEILRLNYVAINPPNPASTYYKYRLVGHDKEWIENGQSLEALYSNLKKGNYQFEVWAQDSTLNWESKVNLINIKVYQVWWKNIWLYFFIGLMLLGSLFYFFQKREKEKQAQFLKESNFEKQIAEVQMQALRSQMNPHFLFNSLNSIKHYVINKDKRDAANYLTKFSKLVRNILQNSNHSLVPLEKELELIKLYMEIESMRFENPFEIEIDVDQQLNTDQVFLPPMLLQPYVENAIWHGLRYKEKDGKITIKVLQNEIGIICSIEDNGVGRAKAAEIRDKNLIQKKSMGTTITKNRIELINKLFDKTASEETIDLYNDQEQAIGTRVLLHIPNFSTKDYHGSKN